MCHKAYLCHHNQNSLIHRDLNNFHLVIGYLGLKQIQSPLRSYLICIDKSGKPTNFKASEQRSDWKAHGSHNFFSILLTSVISETHSSLKVKIILRHLEGKMDQLWDLGRYRGSRSDVRVWGYIFIFIFSPDNILFIPLHIFIQMFQFFKRMF